MYHTRTVLGALHILTLSVLIRTLSSSVLFNSIIRRKKSRHRGPSFLQMINGKAGTGTQRSASTLHVLNCYTVFVNSSLFSLSFPHLRKMAPPKNIYIYIQAFLFHSYQFFSLLASHHSAIRDTWYLGFPRSSHWGKDSRVCRLFDRWEVIVNQQQRRAWNRGEKQPVQHALASQRLHGWPKLPPSDKSWEMVQRTRLRIILPEGRGGWGVYTLTPESHRLGAAGEQC